LALPKWRGGSPKPRESNGHVQTQFGRAGIAESGISIVDTGDLRQWPLERFAVYPRMRLAPNITINFIIDNRVRLPHHAYDAACVKYGRRMERERE
jgi:hypothetical protein